MWLLGLALAHVPQVLAPKQLSYTLRDLRVETFARPARILLPN